MPDLGDKDLIGIYERLATLESLADEAHRERNEIRVSLKNLNDTQVEMLQKLSRYDGKMGGIILAFAAITATLKLFWEDIRNVFRG